MEPSRTPAAHSDRLGPSAAGPSHWTEASVNIVTSAAAELSISPECCW